MPDRHDNPTIADYVAAMITREDARRIDFLDDGLTARIVVAELSVHYVEMTLDTDTFAMHEAVDTRDFDDAERDPITTTYPNVAAFIAWLEEGQ